MEIGTLAAVIAVVAVVAFVAYRVVKSKDKPKGGGVGSGSTNKTPPTQKK